MFKHSNFLETYEIEGSTNFDPNPVFHSNGSYPKFQEELTQFKEWIQHAVSNSMSSTIYKFGDGDYHFLRKSAVGSASPGRRALSKSYESLVDHHKFVEGVCKNDLIAVELYNRHLFHQLFPSRRIDLPAEYGYGLVSSKWLTKNFSGKIGLIGASEKLTLIENLVSYPQYQDFLCLNKFNDYVTIPQKFACDNLEELEKDIAAQLQRCDKNTSIFLVGIGHVKSGLLHRLKKYSNAVFYDVGSGIDALAGIVDFERPYMGGWTNFRIRDFDYSKIDFLNYIPVQSKEVWL